MEIPRILHQIWYQGQDQLPSEYQPKQELWKKFHPQWKYQLWDQSSMKNFIITYYPKYQKTYRNFLHMHQKIDFFKYLILYHQGGVYVDMDAKPLKPLDSLFNNYPQAKIIVSELPINTIESYCLVGFPRMINNGTILASPGHPFLFDLITKINNTYHHFLDLTKYNMISRTTGPKVFTEIALKYQSIADMIILPSKYLEPCYGNDTQCQIPPESYIDHQHSQTWVNPVIIYASKFYFFIKNYWYYFVIILFLIFFYRVK